jgi:hypothetical protein
MGCVEETLLPGFERVHCGLLRKDRKCLCVVVCLVAYVRACTIAGCRGKIESVFVL